MKHLINDHLIEIPEDMSVVLENGFPGAHDRIVYRHTNIYTQDVEDYDGKVYAGKFSVENGWGQLNVVNTLDEARQVIDDMLMNENLAEMME